MNSYYANLTAVLKSLHFSEELFGARDNVACETYQGIACFGGGYPPRKIEPPLRVQHLLDQEMVLVLPSNHAHLPKKGKPVKIEKVISNDMEIKIVMYNRQLDIPANNKVLAYLRQRGADFGPSQKLEGINIAAIIEMLRNIPNTVSILPISAVRNELEAGRLIAYSLDPPMRPWPWGVISRIQSSRPAVEHFLEGFKALQLLKLS